MLSEILKMYVTLAPAIFAGILNMLWCTLPVLATLAVPLDAGRTFIDGRRLLGDNKTWKGLLGYVAFGMLCTLMWGFVCRNETLEALNYFYVHHANTWTFNLLVGALLGFAYAIFELPNSFMKRRLGIMPGKMPAGAERIFFSFLDQADSVFGCALVVWLFYDLGILRYLAIVFVGALTHSLLNLILYFMGLRKNPL